LNIITFILLFDNKIYSKCIDYDLTSFGSTTYLLVIFSHIILCQNGLKMKVKRSHIF